MTKKYYTLQEAIDGFWNQVDKSPNATGCWIWNGFCDSKNYGMIGGILRKHVGTSMAHRVSASLSGIDINNKDKPVLRHMCHNPKCVNPDHLKTGTHAENSRDMTEANRQNKGTLCRSAKLKENDIREIRSFYASKKYIMRELCNIYGVNKSTMSGIINNKTWKHVT